MRAAEIVLPVPLRLVVARVDEDAPGDEAAVRVVFVPALDFGICQIPAYPSRG